MVFESQGATPQAPVVLVKAHGALAGDHDGLYLRILHLDGFRFSRETTVGLPGVIILTVSGGYQSQKMESVVSL